MKLKMLFVMAVWLALPAFLGQGVLQAEPAGRELIPSTQRQALVSLEKLEAEFFPANRVVSIKGAVKNTSNVVMRGYLTLYLISSSGAVLTSFDMPLNDHRPFRNGETVGFDTSVNVSNINGASQVSVEFTKD